MSLARTLSVALLRLLANCAAVLLLMTLSMSSSTLTTPLTLAMPRM